MELYYYVRDKLNRPRLTVCVALCSMKDQPCKKIGRQIAAGRAWKALRNPAIERLCSEVDLPKGEFMPCLTRLERQLLDRARRSSCKFVA